MIRSVAVAICPFAANLCNSVTFVVRDPGGPCIRLRFASLPLAVVGSESVATPLPLNLDAVLGEFRRIADGRASELLSHVVNSVTERFVRHLPLARNRFGLLSRIARRRVQTEGQLHTVVVALQERGRVDCE